MENNEHLYHYTSVETLALILKNRSIRFNSLDKMDDLQEQETDDLKNAGQFVYVSSWTDDESESIPMWNMYASLDKGVRIRLYKNPFKLYNNTAEALAKVNGLQITGASQGNSIQTLIPLAEIFSKGFISIQAITKDFLCKVEYTDEKEKLYPKLLLENGNQFSINFGKLGKYKNLHWQFQKEWRYILNFYPLNLMQSPDKINTDFQMFANRLLFGAEKQPFSYYDMIIDDKAFTDMQVTLSPRIGAGSRVIVQDLIEKYNPTAELKESCLSGML